jgi:hypothetical protein
MSPTTPRSLPHYKFPSGRKTVCMHVTAGACHCHFHPQEENTSNCTSLLSVENGLSLEYLVTGIKTYMAHRGKHSQTWKYFLVKQAISLNMPYPSWASSFLGKKISTTGGNKVIKISWWKSYRVWFLVVKIPGTNLDSPAILDGNVDSSFCVPPKIL